MNRERRGGKPIISPACSPEVNGGPWCSSVQHCAGATGEKCVCVYVCMCVYVSACVNVRKLRQCLDAILLPIVC